MKFPRLHGWKIFSLSDKADAIFFTASNIFHLRRRRKVRLRQTGNRRCQALAIMTTESFVATENMDEGGKVKTIVRKKKNDICSKLITSETMFPSSVTEKEKFHANIN